MVDSRRRIDGIEQVLNQDWPLSDKDGPHARGIQNQPPRRPVRARVVFEHDGEKYLDGVAQGWTASHVTCRDC